MNIVDKGLGLQLLERAVGTTATTTDLAIALSNFISHRLVFRRVPVASDRISGLLQSFNAGGVARQERSWEFTGSRARNAGRRFVCA